jgi:hypothetical protein
VTDHFRVGQERVGVEGENHRGPIEPEHEIEVPPVADRSPRVGSRR